LKIVVKREITDTNLEPGAYLQIANRVEITARGKFDRRHRVDFPRN
jgi:hypothetical protein